MNPVREPDLPRPVIPLAEMGRFIANSANQPFCMIVASEYPHGPYIKDTPFTESDIQMPPYLPSTEGNLRRATQYYASIAQKEKEFQAVLNLLKKHNRESDTLVLYADDHGADMGKFSVSDRGSRIKGLRCTDIKSTGLLLRITDSNCNSGSYEIIRGVVGETR